MVLHTTFSCPWLPVPTITASTYNFRGMLRDVMQKLANAIAPKILIISLGCVILLTPTIYPNYKDAVHVS